MNGSARALLSDLPVFQSFFSGGANDTTTFDQALMHLKSLHSRAMEALAPDLETCDGDWRTRWASELQSNPLRVWLEGRDVLPETMRHAPARPVDRVRFIVDVLSALLVLDVTAHPPVSLPRADKRRKSTLSEIEHLEESLDDGVVVLTRSKRALLQQLLLEAKGELTASRSGLGSVHHRGLVWLSQTLAFVGADERARAASILEVAALVRINCDPKTAAKYAGMSGRLDSPALKIWHAMNSAEWHLFDVLEQNS